MAFYVSDLRLWECQAVDFPFFYHGKHTYLLMESIAFFKEATKAKSRKGLQFRRVHTIVILATPRMEGWLFLAGGSKNLLAPSSASPKMFNCSCFTTPMDIVDETTT